MLVYIDGNRVTELEGIPGAVLQTIEAVSGYLRERGRAIVSLTADGRDVSPEQLLPVLSDAPSGGFLRLDVGSADIHELVRTSLDEVSAVLPELSEVCHGLAQVVQHTPDGQFRENFAMLEEIWSVLAQRQREIAGALNLDLASLVVDGVPVSRHHEDIAHWLETCAVSMEAKDTPRVADVLEYELAPRADREEQIMALLLARLEGS